MKATRRLLLCLWLILLVVSTAHASSYVLATGPAGGTYSGLGAAMAAVWNRHVKGITVSYSASKASVENLTLLGQGQADLALAMNSIAALALTGSAPFTEQHPTIRAIGVVYPEVLHMVAARTSGITSLAMLRGKRVAIGPEGSGSSVLARLLLEAAELDQGSMELVRDGFSTASTKLASGRLDASMAVLLMPAGTIRDLSATTPLTLLAVEEEVLTAVLGKDAAYSRFSIPAGTYGNAKPVTTITCQAVLYCRSDLPEEDVYRLTAALYEHAGEIGQFHPGGKYINLNSALEGVTTPLHPGASRYYREKGLNPPT